MQGHPRWAAVLLILLMRPVVLLAICWTQGSKAQAKRLEEDAESLRNCRHRYSLLDGMAAVTPPLIWLML